MHTKLTAKLADIQLIMFDMDGTLLDLAFDNHFWQTAVPKAWATAYKYDLEQAKAQLYPLFKAQEGHLNWYSLNYWSDVLKLDLAKLKQQLADGISVRPHVLATLQVLKQSQKPMWLVTNAHPVALQIKLSQVHLSGFFDVIISSHELHAAKESQQFWQALQQQHPFNPAHTLLVDDSLAVLHAAQQFGLQTLAISQPDSTGELRQISQFNSIHHFNELLHHL